MQRRRSEWLPPLQVATARCPLRCIWPSRSPSLRYYVKAIEAFPNHGSVLIKYGHLLKTVKKDLKGAEQMYLRAAQACPDDADW